jgi:hypothetical protein
MSPGVQLPPVWSDRCCRRPRAIPGRNNNTAFVIAGSAFLVRSAGCTNQTVQRPSSRRFERLQSPTDDVMQADDKEKLQRSVEDSFSESDGLILGRDNEVGNLGLLER